MRACDDPEEANTNVYTHQGRKKLHKYFNPNFVQTSQDYHELPLASTEVLKVVATGLQTFICIPMNSSGVKFIPSALVDATLMRATQSVGKNIIQQCTEFRQHCYNFIKLQKSYLYVHVYVYRNTDTNEMFMDVVFLFLMRVYIILASSVW